MGFAMNNFEHSKNRFAYIKKYKRLRPNQRVSVIYYIFAYRRDLYSPLKTPILTRLRVNKFNIIIYLGIFQTIEIFLKCESTMEWVED